MATTAVQDPPAGITEDRIARAAAALDQEAIYRFERGEMMRSQGGGRS